MKGRSVRAVMSTDPDPDEPAERLRELIREAHGVTKDLNREMKAVRRAIPELTKETLEAAVERQLADLYGTTRQAMDHAVGKVQQEFDRLAALLLGTDGDGQLTLAEHIERIAHGTHDAVRNSYYDLWRTQPGDDYTFTATRTRIEPGKSFSIEALEGLRELVWLFIGARLVGRWEATGEPPTVLTVRVEVRTT